MTCTLRELREFEMTSKYNARHGSSATSLERYAAVKKRDSNRKQPLYPPVQADDYLSPVHVTTQAASAEQKENNTAEEVNDTENSKTTNSKEDENPYQSLIGLKPEPTSADGYVKVIRPSVSFSGLEDTPPPPIPPKPELSPQMSTTPQLACNSPQKSENIYSNSPHTL